MRTPLLTKVSCNRCRVRITRECLPRLLVASTLHFLLMMHWRLHSHQCCSITSLVENGFNCCILRDYNRDLDHTKEGRLVDVIKVPPSPFFFLHTWRFACLCSPNVCKFGGMWNSGDCPRSFCINPGRAWFHQTHVFSVHHCDIKTCFASFDPDILFVFSHHRWGISNAIELDLNA